MQINDEIVLTPRAYDDYVFDMLCGTEHFTFRQNTIHGGQPIAHFYSSINTLSFHGYCSIPNCYNKSYIDSLITHIYTDVYIKTNRQFNRKC